MSELSRMSETETPELFAVAEFSCEQMTRILAGKSGPIQEAIVGGTIRALMLSLRRQAAGATYELALQMWTTLGKHTLDQLRAEELDVEGGMQ